VKIVAISTTRELMTMVFLFPLVLVVLLLGTSTTAFVRHDRFGFRNNCLVSSLSSSTYDDDAAFYRDLKEAKKKILGAPIPPEQLKDSAVDAEQEFLEAMKQTKKEFEEAKEELGSKDAAIDFFLQKLREVDEQGDEEEE
jgi:hypothetical protein